MTKKENLERTIDLYNEVLKTMGYKMVLDINPLDIRMYDKNNKELVKLEKESTDNVNSSIWLEFNSKDTKFTINNEGELRIYLDDNFIIIPTYHYSPIEDAGLMTKFLILYKGNNPRPHESFNYIDIGIGKGSYNYNTLRTISAIVAKENNPRSKYQERAQLWMKLEQLDDDAHISFIGSDRDDMIIPTDPNEYVKLFYEEISNLKYPYPLMIQKALKIIMPTFKSRVKDFVNEKNRKLDLRIEIQRKIRERIIKEKEAIINEYDEKIDEIDNEITDLLSQKDNSKIRHK